MAYVILTRPFKQSQAVMQRLTAQGISGADIIIAPAIEIVPLKRAGQARNTQAAIFTSSHAPIMANIASCAAFCVGETTAQAAKDAGFDVQFVAPTAQGLLLELAKHKPTGHLHYFRGKHISLDLCTALRDRGCDIGETIVYEQRPAALSEAVLAKIANTNGAIVPLYSRRTAEILAGQAPRWQGHITVCLSANIAAQAHEMGFDTVQIAASPETEVMLQAILRAYTDSAA